MISPKSVQTTVLRVPVDGGPKPISPTPLHVYRSGEECPALVGRVKSGERTRRDAWITGRIWGSAHCAWPRPAAAEDDTEEMEKRRPPHGAASGSQRRAWQRQWRRVLVAVMVMRYAYPGTGSDGGTCSKSSKVGLGQWWGSRLDGFFLRLLVPGSFGQGTWTEKAFSGTGRRDPTVLPRTLARCRRYRGHSAKPSRSALGASGYIVERPAPGKHSRTS
jgi:hypothetical protein